MTLETPRDQDRVQSPLPDPPREGCPKVGSWEDGLWLQDLDRPCSSQLPDRRHMAWVFLQREE